MNCEIENWKFGPVVGEIYHKFKVFGQAPIKVDITTPPSLDDNTILLLDKIHEVYGKFNGIQLSTLSHVANGPWDKTKNKSIIDNDIISEWFKAQARTTGKQG